MAAVTPLTTMKTLLPRLAAVTLTACALVLTSCARPYGSGVLGSGIARTRATPPLLTSAVAGATQNAQANSWLFRNTRYDPCSPYYGGRSTASFGLLSLFTRHSRPYYSNYGWGRPYYGSTWYGSNSNYYAYPYTSQWRSPGYSRYYSYGSPCQSYGWPMSHYGGWSYVYRPVYWPTSTSYRRYGW